MSELQAIILDLGFIALILGFNLSRIYDVLSKIHSDLERISKLEKDLSSQSAPKTTLS